MSFSTGSVAVELVDIPIMRDIPVDIPTAASSECWPAMIQGIRDRTRDNTKPKKEKKINFTPKYYSWDGLKGMLRGE